MQLFTYKSTLRIVDKCRQLFYIIDLSIEYFFINEISKYRNYQQTYYNLCQFFE